jgi:hypothetical protein
MTRLKRRRYSLVVILVLSALANGCGGSGDSSPTSSSPVPGAPPVPANVVDINGTWVGTLETNLGVQQITLTVVQFANCVDGTYRSSSSDLRGAISGFAAEASYTGLVSLEIGACWGVADVTGPVEGGTLRWTGSNVTRSAGSGACPDPLPQSITLSLRRQ